MNEDPGAGWQVNVHGKTARKERSREKAINMDFRVQVFVEMSGRRSNGWGPRCVLGGV